jgi:hypothetical protein
VGTHLPKNLLTVFHEKCPQLKELEITYPPDMSRFLGYSSEEVQPEGTGDVERALYAEPEIARFSGLKSLVLKNLFEDLGWFRNRIVEVLVQSPELEGFEVSLGVKTILRHHRQNERDKFENWFDELCAAYGATGAKPLRLRYLGLAGAVFPFKEKSIHMLTDLKHLEELRLENDSVWDSGHMIVDIYNYADEDSGIAFEELGPDNCPRLRRFSLACLHRDVNRLLANSDPAWLRQIAFSARDTWGGYEWAGLLRSDELFPSYPVHPRMMHIELKRDQVILKDEDGEHWDDDDKPTAEEVLNDLVSGDDVGALEGLAVHLEIKEEGSESEICFEDFDMFADALSKLPNLTQLAVVEYGRDERLIKPEEAEHAARLLAAAGSRIRYLRVHNRYWRVWREEGDNIRLGTLSPEERRECELFSFLNWKPNPF